MFAKLKYFVSFLLIFNLIMSSCGQTSPVTESESGSVSTATGKITTGAERVEAYLPFLSGKKVAAMVNQTSMINGTHLVDSLVSLGVRIEKIFAPEHGFRGEADAGEKVLDATDPQTGIPIISLYGKKQKPGPEDLEGLDLVIYDIQDVGVRFYTFISAMSYMMESCAENKVPLLILDRPNPNGHYLDGPVLEPAFQSYVGLHPVPVVYGLTTGEYAQMVNGEGWLAGGASCNLTVIPCEHYDHKTFYDLPVRPSPNLPNIRSIYLYPSLCFMEGTQVSIGRGTQKQFQVVGAPDFRMVTSSLPPFHNPVPCLPNTTA